jgi:hypothetical protein
MASHLTPRLTLFAISLVLGASAALAQRPACPGDDTRPRAEQPWAFRGAYIEEDLLYPRQNEDRNYTGGLGLQFVGGQLQQRGLMSPLNAIDRLTHFRRRHCRPDGEGIHGRFHALMFTGVAYTPEDLRAAEPIRDDRPYASLMAITLQRMTVSEDQERVWSSQLVLGALGLRVMHDIQASAHVVGRRYFFNDSEPPDPKGWDNQISNGGEPTAMYRVAYERLWASDTAVTRVGRVPLGYDVSIGRELNVGYYTNAALLLRARAGMIRSKFWQSTVNPMTGVNQFPARAAGTASRRPDLSFLVFAGLRPRVIVYNALLNGQTRDSEHTFGWDRTQHVLVESEIGGELTIPLRRSSLLVTLVFPAGRTAEFRGPMSRTHYWGALYFALSPRD